MSSSNVCFLHQHEYDVTVDDGADDCEAHKKQLTGPDMLGLQPLSPETQREKKHVLSLIYFEIKSWGGEINCKLENLISFKFPLVYTVPFTLYGFYIVLY